MMKNKIIFLSFFLVIWGKDIIPIEEVQQVQLEISGKIREYFLVNPGDTISFFLPEQCIWKLSSRVVLSPGASGKQNYAIGLSTLDTTFTANYYVKKSLQTNVVNHPHHRVSVAKTTIDYLSNGNEIVLFWIPQNAKNPVLVRLRAQLMKKEKPKYHFVKPATDSDNIRILVNEKKRRYEKIFPEQNIVYNLVGPGYFRLHSRMLFEEEKDAISDFKIAFQVDENECKIQISSAEIDPECKIKNTAILISKSGCETIKIPDGKHRVIITNPNQKPLAVRGRFAPR